MWLFEDGFAMSKDRRKLGTHDQTSSSNCLKSRAVLLSPLEGLSEGFPGSQP